MHNWIVSCIQYDIFLARIKTTILSTKKSQFCSFATTEPGRGCSYLCQLYANQLKLLKINVVNAVLGAETRHTCYSSRHFWCCRLIRGEITEFRPKVRLKKLICLRWEKPVRKKEYKPTQGGISLQNDPEKFSIDDITINSVRKLIL